MKAVIKDIFLNHSNQAAWHAMKRTDPRVGGSEEWNYLIVDGYKSLDEKRNRSVNVPKDLSKEINKKYGNFLDMRDLKHQVVTTLLMSAAE